MLELEKYWKIDNRAKHKAQVLNILSEKNQFLDGDRQ